MWLEVNNEENAGGVFNAFDELVLDVDMRRLLRAMLEPERWYKRTERSYGFEDPDGWLIPGGLERHFDELNDIRKYLLDVMTDPEHHDLEVNREKIHHFLQLENSGLHPCYLIYNYEAVAVHLWYHRFDHEDRKLRDHFSKVIKARLDEVVRNDLQRHDERKAHYERLVERIISVAERLRFEQITRYKLAKILNRIEESSTKARIEALVAAE
jgi:hypothetical protein